MGMGFTLPWADQEKRVCCFVRATISSLLIEAGVIGAAVSAVVMKRGCYRPASLITTTNPRVSFGREVDGALFVPLRQLGPEPAVEVWPHPELLFGALTLEENGSLESLTRGAYARMIEDARAAGYPYFLRMWNYVGDINEFDEGRERYQLFCAGRHDAFVAAGYQHGADLPAASAVGSHGRGLVVYFLASREPGVQVENPRQISAYDYPAQYGPKSPSFSRLTVWRSEEHTSELQSPCNLVCRLLLEKKN